MAEMWNTFDLSDWQCFDGHGLSLEPGFNENEVQRYRGAQAEYFDPSQSQLHGLDSFKAPETSSGSDFQQRSPVDFFYPSQQMDAIGTGECQQPGEYNGNLSPTREIASEHQNNPPNFLDELLRSTPQLATQRALYMNDPVSSPSNLEGLSQSPFTPTFPLLESPILDLCSSPETSQPSDSGIEEDHDLEFSNLNFYSLPDGSGATAAQRSTGVIMQKKQTSALRTESDDLTPLEMPDGSTRFTANWLPVDSECGFTIGGTYDDVEPMAYGQHAFFSADMSVSNFIV